MIWLVLLLGCGEREPVQTPAPAPKTGKVVVENDGLEADLNASQTFFASRPEYEQPLDAGQSGVQSAETCGACHPAIYQEWKVSTHALAWVDKQFQEEIQKSDNIWLCRNCHTPLMVQQPEWPRGLVDGDVERPIVAANPGFDESLQQEGITCSACHVRDGEIHGPGISDGGPHGVVADTDYTDGGLCLRCHQAVATYEGKGFVCTFDTGTEWREGPWDDEGYTCQTCHMPKVDRPATIGGLTRSVGHHWWRGAGIPKVAGVHPPAEANPPGLGLSWTVGEDEFVLAYENANAGHRLPTGDPERWVQIQVSIDGDEVWTERIGQVWEWSPVPKKVADNRLAPRERREARIPVPDGASGALVVASSHRISEDNADYHGLLGEYPLSVETHRYRVNLQPPE